METGDPKYEFQFLSIHLSFRSLLVLSLQLLALLLRFVLAASGFVVWFGSRPELTTPQHSLSGFQEGAFLLQEIKDSPYAGSLFHGSPLLLQLLKPFIFGTTTNTIISAYVAFDVANALLLGSIAACLKRRLCHAPSKSSTSAAHGGKGCCQWAKDLATLLPTLYLWNPLTVMACVAGSATSAETAAVLTALLGGLLANPVVAGVGVALAVYLSPHQLLLLIPVGMLLWRGPEDVFAAEPPPAGSPPKPSPSTPSAVPPAGEPPPAPSPITAHRLHDVGLSPSDGSEDEGDSTGSAGAGGPRSGARGPVARSPERHEGGAASAAAVGPAGGTAGGLGSLGVAALVATVAAALLCLMAMSNAVLLPVMGAGAGAGGGPLSLLRAVLLDGRLRSEWMEGCYGFLLRAEDLRPNIGLWWYFVTEIFDGFRPFFLFVMHCQCAVFAAPLALRFPDRPVMLSVLHCITMAMLRPYPSAGDVALYLSLLPLLWATLRHMRHALLLATALVAIAALQPMLWRMWIETAVANANFYYASTIALGLFHAVLICDIAQAGIARDSALAGKPPAA